MFPPGLRLVTTKHKPEQLAHLLACSEHIIQTPEDLERLLETICEIQSPNNCIKTATQFRKLEIIGQSRGSLESVDPKVPQSFAPFDILTHEGLNFESFYNHHDYHQDLFFDLIISASQTCIADENLAKFVENAVPCSALLPPTVGFFMPHWGATQIFHAKRPLPHGIATNGHLLMVLDYESILHIFSLTSIGTIQPPFCVNLGLSDLTIETSVSIKRDEFVVVSYNSIRAFSVKDLLNGNPVVIRETRPHHPGIVCGNGIREILYDREGVVGRNGRKHVLPGMKEIVVLGQFDELLSVTNGSFLAFVVRIDHVTFVFHVISLITGELVHHEKFYAPEELCAMTVDTHNMCMWVVARNGDGDVFVRCFRFHGSLCPSLIGFHLTQPEKPTEKFCSFAMNWSKLAMHYLGTRTIPKVFICSQWAKMIQLVDATSELCDLYQKKRKDKIFHVIQGNVILIDVNMGLIDESLSKDDAFYKAILRLIQKLPSELACICFYSHLDYFFSKDENTAVQWLLNLVSRPLKDKMMLWILKKIEACSSFARVSLNGKNMLRSSLDVEQISQLEPQILSVLFIHQRVLCRTAGFELFRGYSMLLIDKVVRSLTAVDALASSVAGILFENFVYLLCSLTSVMEFAEFVVTEFRSLFENLIQVAMDVSVHGKIPSVLLLFAFSFVRSTVTLMSSRTEQVSMLGLSTLVELLPNDIHTPILECMAFALITSDGFKGVLQNSAVNRTISDFARKLLSSFTITHDTAYSMTAFVLWRDLLPVISDKNELVPVIWKAYIQNNQPISLFPLVYLVSDELQENELTLNSVWEWILTLKILAKRSCSPHLFHQIATKLFDSPEYSKLVCGVLYHALNSPLISIEDVESFLVRLRECLSKWIKELQSLDLVPDLIWLVRKVILENHTKKDLFIKHLIKECKSAATFFALIGFSMEPVRSYCLVKYHQNTSFINCVVIPSPEQEEIVGYPIPFNFDHSPVTLRKDSRRIYAYPALEMDESTLPCVDKILSFFGKCSRSLIVSLLFSQTLARFTQFNSFVNKLTPSMLESMTNSVVSFSNIHRTVELLRTINERVGLLPNFQGFFPIKRGQQITYMSPLLFQSTRVSVHLASGYIGIVSSAIEKECSRYLLVKVPSGEVYPAFCDPIEFEDSEVWNVKINMKKKVFYVNGQAFGFPRGDMFRLVIGITDDVPLNIDYDESCFDESRSLCFRDHDLSGRTQILNIEQLDEDQIVGCVSWNRLSREQKLTRYFTEPPIVLHFSDGEFASASLVEFTKRMLSDRLAKQYSTIALMRIAVVKPKLLRGFGHLLASVLIQSLEVFDKELFAQNKFFFDLNNPVWSIHTEYDKEMKLAVKGLFADSVVRGALVERVQLMCSKPQVHCCAVMGRNVSFFPQECEVIVSKRFGILTSCERIVSPFPLIISNGDCPSLSEHPDLVFLNVSSKDNSYLHNTVFELLLLIKNLVFVVTDTEEKNTLKAALIDIFASGSPFAYRYVNEFVDLVQKQIPATPIDTTSEYTKHLVILKNALKQEPCDFMERFYYSETRTFHLRNLCLSFPEFFPSKLPKPDNEICTLPIPNMDPDVDTIRRVLEPRQSLIGFPFWDVLPYWLIIANVPVDKKTRKKKTTVKFVDPSLHDLNEKVKVINNPSKAKVKIILRDISFPTDGVVMYAFNEEFRDAEYVTEADLSFPIEITQTEAFFTLGGAEWSQVQLEIGESVPNETEEFEDVEMSFKPTVIKAQFMTEITEFALKWNDKHTNYLLSLIPPELFDIQQFDPVRDVALSSQLAFLPNVLSLKAFFLHRINYVYRHCNDVLPLEYVSPFLTKHTICAKIRTNLAIGTTFPTIEIDCDAPNIISQLISELSRFSDDDLRSTKPWCVSFRSETNVEGIGFAYELATRTAESIFLPSSGLCVAIDGAFVPFARDHSRAAEFHMIGVFLGMVIRSGLVQDFPFAPIVWKYLSYTPITTDDVLDLDPSLSRIHIEGSSTHWNVPDWDGNVAKLPRRSEGDGCLREILRFRLCTLEATLASIREGFSSNTGLLHFGCAELSLLAQGSPVITIEALQQAAVIENHGHPSTVAVFWSSVSRLTQLERRKLLRRTTGLNRVPQSAWQFKLVVDPSTKNAYTSLPHCTLVIPQVMNERECHRLLMSLL